MFFRGRMANLTTKIRQVEQLQAIIRKAKELSTRERKVTGFRQIATSDKLQICNLQSCNLPLESLCEIRLLSRLFAGMQRRRL